MDDWAKELAGKVCICKINVDELNEIAAAYNVRSMPTFVQVDSKGKEVTRKVGAQEIIRFVDQLK